MEGQRVVAEVQPERDQPQDDGQRGTASHTGIAPAWDRARGFYGRGRWAGARPWVSVTVATGEPVDEQSGPVPLGAFVAASAIFVALTLSAFHKPTPHDLPVGIVGPANLASFTPGFLRVLGHALPLGIAASSIRNIVYFGGHATGPYLWTLAAWALAGLAGLIAVTAIQRPGPVRARHAAPAAAAAPPVTPAEPVRAGSDQVPVTLVVGFDDSEPAQRALRWSAGLLRTRPGTLHVVYADHEMVDSDLSGFGRAEMDEERDEKADGAEAGAGEPAGRPIIVTGRSHHLPHQVIGAVPGRLLRESPYPVLTIA